MERRASPAARLFAALALVAAVLIVVVVVAAVISDDPSPRHERGGQQAQKEDKRKRTTAKTYTVQPGDTLTAISDKTGVPVAEIRALNPEVDPQILTVGRTLKLR